MNNQLFPAGWEQSNLGEVAKIERESVQPENIKSGTAFVGLEHIDGEGNFNRVQSVNIGDVASNKFAFDSRHLLYGKLRPYLKKIARPNFQGICSTDILPILPSAHIDRSFLYYYLRQPQYIELATTRSTGANLPRLSPKTLAEFPISCPPLEEQKRIAAILDKADGIRRKRKEAIALIEELLRSTFLDMFGDPVTNPEGSVTLALRDVILQIDAGWSAKGEERQCNLDEWGVFKISAVTSGTFDPQEHKAVGNPSFNKKLIIPKRGDLLFSRANTRELVAATCLVENDCERLFLPDKLWRIKTNSHIANVEYLRFLLADPKYRSLLAREATGTSGSMLNISQAKLLNMYAPVPSLNIQEKFAEFLWRIYKLKERNETSLGTLNQNFNSLLQKAFRGEL